MKQLFSRYSHWLLLFIVCLSFFPMFIDFEASKFELVAVVMGGIGLVSVGYLTFLVEKKIRSEKK